MTGFDTAMTFTTKLSNKEVQNNLSPKYGPTSNYKMFVWGIYVLTIIFRLARAILSANSFKHGPEILIMVIKIESKLLLDS